MNNDHNYLVCHNHKYYRLIVLDNAFSINKKIKFEHLLLNVLVAMLKLSFISIIR